MSIVDFQEYRNLKDTALALEKLLTDSPLGVNPVLQTTLANIQRRLEVLEREIKQDEIKERAGQAVAAAAAEKEAALNASERGIFCDLLRRDYFAKADMPQVNSFYKNIWDKLTDDGKGEISRRLWEGIRHGEQPFSDLADDIKEKEAERLHKLFTNATIEVGAMAQVPEKDRSDFIRAYEGGNKEEAYRILDRQSFTNNVSVAAPREIENAPVEKNRESKSKSIEAVAAAPILEITEQKNDSEPQAIGKIDLDSINLDNLKVADKAAQGIAAPALRSDASVKRSL